MTCRAGPASSRLAFLALAHAAGLVVHGADAMAPAAAAGFLGMFVYGMAEPERGAWCACEWAKHESISNMDNWYLRRDERSRRNP